MKGWGVNGDQDSNDSILSDSIKQPSQSSTGIESHLQMANDTQNSSAL